MIMLISLLLVVVFLFILPINKRPVSVDEKGEAIKVYQDEAAHINRQHQKGLISDTEKYQLLAELDKKSALAIVAIEKKTFAYRPSLLSFAVILIGLMIASLIYGYHYQKNGVANWQTFKSNHHGEIIAGLFNVNVIHDFISANPANKIAEYCFAMQQTLLKKYDTNANALANLALCQLQAGYPKLAAEAANRGLKTKPKHSELNYLLAEIDFLKNGHLSPQALDRLFVTIKQQPQHFGALRLLAINSMNMGDYQQAKFFFNELRKVAHNNPALLTALDKVNANINEKMGKQSKRQDDKKRASTTSNSINTPAKILPKATPQITSKVIAQKTIHISVAIAPSLAKLLSGEQTLFIIVKSPDGRLINASKHLLSHFEKPLSLTINDNQSGMMKLQSMRDFDKVSVVARISLNGSPMARQGDMTSTPQTIVFPQSNPPPNIPLLLLIDQRIP